MKKKYVRPELIYEQYILNQHMATSCVLEFRGSADETNCRAVGTSYLKGITLFNPGGACGADSTAMQNYCYYPSSNTYRTLSTHGSAR